MAIDSLGSSTAVSFSQYSVTSSTVAPAQGDSDASGGTPSVPPSGGRFATAIEQTLAQLGGSGATSATSSSSSTSGASGSGATQDPTQAEQAFAQNLFSALQSQFGSQQQAQGAQQGEGGGHHHHHHGGGGGGGRIASALDSLAQSLTSSSSGDSSSSSSTSSASSDLQTSFNNLLAATGQSGSSTTLPQFLQSLAQNLQGGSNSGNLLSVKV